jgi:hypothetical protein
MWRPYCGARAFRRHCWMRRRRASRQSLYAALMVVLRRTLRDEMSGLCIRSVRELAARCIRLMRSIDEPNLYFPGVGLDGAGTTQMNIAVMARTVMSHIRGRARLDMEPTPHRLNHLDMVRHLAARDPESFAAEGGWEHYRDLSLKLDADQPFPMP